MHERILTSFESAVIEWISVHSPYAALQDQLRNAVLVDRDHTGQGCYSTIAVPDDSPVSTAAYSTGDPLRGPFFESTAVEHGRGTLLSFEKGRTRCSRSSLWAPRSRGTTPSLGSSAS